MTEPHQGKPNRSKRKTVKRNKPNPRVFIPLPPPKNCNTKIRFSTQEEAQVMCDELNERYAMQQILAEVYFCNKHVAWHVGHNRRKVRRANEQEHT